VVLAEFSQPVLLRKLDLDFTRQHLSTKWDSSRFLCQHLFVSDCCEPDIYFIAVCCFSHVFVGPTRCCL